MYKKMLTLSDLTNDPHRKKKLHVVLDECDALEDWRTPSAVRTPLPEEEWETTTSIPVDSFVVVFIGAG